MKTISLTFASLVILACAANAAPKKKAPDAAAKAAKAGLNEAGIYDKDKNGYINGSEVRVVQDAYRQGANLGTYDTDHNKELSDAEIAKIRTAHKSTKAVKEGKVFIAPKKKGKRGKRR